MSAVIVLEYDGTGAAVVPISPAARAYVLDNYKVPAWSWIVHETGDAPVLYTSKTIAREIATRFDPYQQGDD